ncbi:hypothetical protein LCGC14_0734400 [marine sediment metagenome]|uniref:Uncharacterized protein n=1 Tax=marine sediment metagenome TaxID=412755 RepID=A0A0F9STS1_9ZZZZ
MNEKQLETFEFELKTMLDSIHMTIEPFTDRVRKMIMLPYCAKKNYAFMSGMGTYFFIDESNEVIDENDEDAERELVLIFKMLDAEIVGRFTVGEYMNDVTLEDVKGYRDVKM